MGIYKYLIVILVLIFPLSNEVYARPISWSGGSTFMYKTDSMKSSYYYHYSPLYRYSLGVEYVNDRHFNDQYFNLRGTYLLDRENTKSSQRNFYITGGLSTKSSDNFIYGIQGDWETRRLYSAISHTNQHTKTKDFSENLKRILKSKVHKFKIDGKYLMDIGMEQGALMGKVLKKIEEEWIKNNFKITKDQIKEIVKSNSN